MVNRNLRRIHQTFLFIFATGVCGGLTGCIATTTEFTPAKSSQRILVFDRYWIDLRGFKSRGEDFVSIFIEPVKSISVTTPLDSIPVLLIDSVCLSGACVSLSSCEKPSGGYEHSVRDRSMSIGTALTLSPAADLEVGREEYYPFGYSLKGDKNLRSACAGK